jgi:aldehyde dehydrogenase (NAD+)
VAHALSAILTINLLRLLLPGSRHGTRGYFIQPTVFTDVTMDMQIAREEIFGPVASVIQFSSEEEAISIANSTEYGLAAAVHSLDINQVQRVTRRLKAGTVWVNQYVMLSHQVPFGGYKQSVSCFISLDWLVERSEADEAVAVGLQGWGRELGEEGLDAYLITKSVHHYYGEPFEWPIKV